MLLLASRQTGKSLTAAALALKTALLEPGQLVLLLSPTQRQSGELFQDKVLRLYHRLGRPQAALQETQLALKLTNGSRVVSLPGANDAAVRGYSRVALLVIDEAARVKDSLYRAVRPMLAVSGGRLIALSSAYAKLGWFYESWTGGEDWQRVKVVARDCPRIPPAFLEEERRELGQRWYEMEYEGIFGDLLGAVFRGEDIARAIDPGLEPLFA
jgi:hypothetical protein